MKNYENVIIFDHPLIRHKIAILRDEKTSMKEFRELVEEITTLMTYESLKDGVPTTEIEVKTPLESCKQTVVADNSIVIVPILRAGLGMVNGVHVLFPLAKVGHVSGQAGVARHGGGQEQQVSLPLSVGGDGDRFPAMGEFGFFAQTVHQIVDLGSAAVNQDDLNANEPKENDVLHDLHFQLLIDHGVAAVFDHDDLTGVAFDIGKCFGQHFGALRVGKIDTHDRSSRKYVLRIVISNM